MILNSNEHFLTCKDYTVSGEEFQLYWNEDKTILITSPPPSLTELPEYYKSEAYISHTDASVSLFDKIYQTVKQYMLQKKVRLISSFASSTKNVLDIGAGTGDFLKAAQVKKWNVSGIEPNQKARALAKEKGVELFENSDNFAEGSFDVITMWHVLEHVPNLEEQIKKLYMLLKGDGYVVIAVPNFKSYDATYYKEFWAAYDVPRHLWHFSQEGIKNLFASHSFQLQQTLPLKFDAYYVSMLSEKNKTGKNNFIHAIWKGFKSNLKAKRNGEYSSLIYIFKKPK